MITIQEALQIVNSQPIKQAKITMSVIDSLGYCLAENIPSPMDLPSFDNSAMDGFAVSGSGDTFTVIGEIAAGDPTSYVLRGGEAFRIFTGAKVPENTTAVIMQEKTEVTNDQLKLSEEITEGKNIRRKGEEIAAGQVVFEAGQEINPAATGLLSSLGIERVPVYKKSTIAILTTGNELIKPGNPLKPGQIYESNGLTLQSVVRRYGFECTENHHKKDDYKAIRNAIADLLHASDVLLISGGISVGEYDYVKKALEENGVEELFYKVKQKPGKPLYFGRHKNKFVFALPGNPASSLTCFYIYVLPLLQRLAGISSPGLMKFEAPLAQDYVMKSDRPSFMKAHFNGEVDLLHGQGSSMLHSYAIGNALALLEGGPKIWKKGETVACYLL